MKQLLSICFSFIFISGIKAQDTLDLTLKSAIEMAQSGSVASRKITNSFQASYWSFKAYQAGRLPDIGLTGTLPNFNRSINAQLLPDGTQDFISTNVFTSSLGLNVSQPIPLSGGEVFVNSGIQRIDNLDLEDPAATSYFTNPISFGFRQSIFAFNSYKWDQKAAPLRYEEASRGVVEELEALAIEVVQVYFNFLLSQENFKIATNNFRNNEQLYQIAKGRYELGKIAENDLLQMELSVLQASNSLESSKIDLQRSKNDLMALLSMDAQQGIDLVIPSVVPSFEVDANKAVTEALLNRKDVISFKRQKIEADRNVAQTKAEKKVQMDLFGSFGLNQSSVDFENAYTRPLDQERFNVGLTIPIYDGGGRKSAYKIAKSEKELVYADIEQQELSFEREVRLKALEVGVLKDRLLISARSDTIAQKRYDITRQRYLIGKIDITELNLSQNSKDQSRRAYIAALRDYWQAYYSLRRLTLYDFRAQERLYKGD